MASREADKNHGWLAAASVALRNYIIFVAVLPLPLAIAQELGLSAAETSSFILVGYGLCGLLGLVLALAFKQPLLLTTNLFSLIFIASLGQEFTFAQLVGAFIVAGGGVLLVSALGLSRRLTTLLPAPIVFGLLAGAIMPFVSRIFTSLGDAPLIVGGAFVAYLLGHLVGGRRLPPILPALIVGVALTGLSGQFGPAPDALSPPVAVITTPAFSPQAILTVSPVLMVLVILQANLPSLVFIRSQGYEPPENVVDATSGLGMMLGSLLGPVGTSLSLPATSLVAGPEAGERELRYRAAALASAGLLVIGLLAGIAADVAALIPPALLATLAGLAVVSVLLNALQRVTRGPLQLGPLFAFAIALSDISFLGFGPYFWALVVGTGVSLLLEKDGLKEIAAET